MTPLRTLIGATLCCLIWGGMTGSALASEKAAEAGLLTGTLTANVSQTLTVTPQKIDLLDKYVYVLGEDGQGSILLQLDASSLEEEARHPLGFDAGDLELSFNGKFIYVIGDRDGKTALTVFSESLDELGTLSVDTPIRYPSLSVSQGEVLIAVGMSGNTGGVLLTFDVSDPEAPRFINVNVPAERAIYGASGAWLDNREQRTFFLNAALLPMLAAFGVSQKGVTEYSQISFEGGGVASQPLTTNGIMPGRFCPADKKENALFLISSITNQTLFLAEFDPSFRSLDIRGRTETSLKLRRGEFRTYEGSEVPRPTGLLDSSCDHGVIWLANTRATEVEQFAINYGQFAPSIEKVGRIPLDYAPTDIAVSTAGRAAYVIESESRTISRYSSDDDSEVIGTGLVRELQRLLAERRYPVGTIDGQIGVKTLGAVKLFEERNNVRLDIRGDLEGSIKKIRKIPVLQLRQTIATPDKASIKLKPQSEVKQ